MTKYFFSIILCLVLQRICAQNVENFSVSAVTESMAFPFTRYLPLHPGLELGFPVRQSNESNIISSMNVMVGWYYHRKIQNAFNVRLEWALNVKIGQKFTADLYSGIGYMHVFFPGEIYETDQNGDFNKKRTYGRPHVLGNIGLGFTYRNSSRFQPFVRQDLGIQSPFANGIPVMIHSFLKAGTHININKNE